MSSVANFADARRTLETPAGEMWWRSNAPQTLIRSVSPEMALHLLDRSPEINRQVKQSKVDQYARQMIAGRWRPVEQQCDAMAFDVNGRCLNGQHRLWAVVESKKTIGFEIKVGLPTDAIASIDDHLKRSDADVYKITHRGDASARHLAIALRLLMSQGRPKGGYDRATKFAMLEEHKAAIDGAIALTPASTRVRGLMSASMQAVLARATYTVPADRLRRFMEVIDTSLASGPTEIAAILLRDWMTNHGAASGTLQNELYWKAERSLRAFLDGDKIKTLYVSQAELFPLPNERSSKKKEDATSPRRVRARQVRVRLSRAKR